jgi:ribonuclease HI
MSKAKQFTERRAQLNDIVMKYAGLNTKRFFNLDTQVYKDGALSETTKEMLGLVASLVLRCDDCVSYHLLNCQQQGVTSEELEEILSVGLIVGGSITIPHLRRALELWDELQSQ